MATLVTPLLCLIHPILSPDYGFAVIDESGAVLFHSDAAKNGRENFFDESLDSRDLRAAVSVRQESMLSVIYEGREHRLCVRPFATIQQCPWSLIVFASLSELSAERAERTLFFAALAVCYLAAVVIVLFMVFGPLSPSTFRDRLSCAWPSERRKGTYHHLALCLGLLIVQFYALIFEAAPERLPFWVLLIPSLSLTVTSLKLAQRTRSITWIAGATFVMAIVGLVLSLCNGEQWWKPSWWLTLICATLLFLSSEGATAQFGKWEKWSLPTSFSLACFLLLILTAGLPCVALFRMAFDYEEVASTRREQLLTMAELRRREEHAIRQYLGVRISDEKNDLSLADDLGKQLFLRRRLEEQSLDLYVTVFADQRANQLFYPKNLAQQTTEPPDERLTWLSLLASWLWLPHSSGPLTYEVSQGSSNTSMWTWSEEGISRIRIHPKYKPPWSEIAAGSPETAGLAKLIDHEPVFSGQELAYDLKLLQPLDFLSTMGFTLAVLFLLMFLSVRSTLQRMFLLNDLKGAMAIKGPMNVITLDRAVCRNGNSILLGLPTSGKTKMLEDKKGKADFRSSTSPR